MSKIKDAAFSVVGKVYTKINSLSQAEQQRSAAEKIITPGMPELLREAAAKGAVLLKNDGVLPLKEDSTVSLFGRVQKDWFYTGYGSGGDVNKPYAVNLIEGIRNCEKLLLDEETAEFYEKWCDRNPIDHGFWGHWPRFYPEMPIGEDFVKRATGDTAVVVIGRSSGEDRENALEKGSYYATDEEIAMLKSVTSVFGKTVVLFNIGCIMDLSFLESFGDKISAVLVVWQGGMESGNAVADMLCGKVSPSGKLPATVARAYEDFPSAADFGNKEYNNYTEDIYVGYRYFETFSKNRVLYPFGFGLTYGDFETKLVSAGEKEEGFEFVLEVKNKGEYPSAYAPQIYVEKPCGVLGNPYRELCAFGKTKVLAKGKKEKLALFVSKYSLASYDEEGKTGYKSAYVIEKGSYGFALGDNVRDAERVFEWTAEETLLYKQLSQVAAPRKDFEIVTAAVKNDRYYIVKNPVFKKEYDLKKIITDNLPEGKEITGDKGYKLIDVKEGRVSMEAFVAQLSLDELEAISRGDYIMNSPLGVSGNAGCFGGVLPSMRDKGIPAATTTDGPSGIRLSASCSLIPIGTLLASTFDEEFTEELLAKLGEEMADKGTDILLAPGMNIHRNPLCGRNFEYFSEDPYLCGKIAAAYVRGVQRNGRSACPKHYACNNQEFNRNGNDSRVSERALREIYLRGFEICVKEAQPKNIMTSYNLINGVWGHYNYELCTLILRNEWGYEGNVMTDWWMRKSKSQEFPIMEDQAYRVRAQVDVLMPGGGRTGKNKKPDGTLLASYGKEGGITLGEMQRTAANVLRFVMNSTAMDRMQEGK
ncbi:MAG: glycoside hydrolase family 3 protein [Clostridia bacterium]|nr:glycoside hydrolase family 3 protein [Clostridia bacterium]